MSGSAVFLFLVVACSAQGRERPARGRIDLDLAVKHVRDRDILPESWICGWQKGEIDRGFSVVAEGSYALTRRATIRSFLGHTSVDIRPVKTCAPCPYRTREDGIVLGAAWRLTLVETGSVSLWSEFEISRHQMGRESWIDEWQVIPLMLDLTFAGFVTRIGGAYTDFRIRDGGWRFRAEELFAVILGVRWDVTDALHLEARADFIPELTNRHVGNANGFDAYSFTLRVGCSF